MIPGGKIVGPTPNLVNQSNVVAEKVANVAAPASASTVWDKLGQRPDLAIERPMSLGLSARTPGTYGTSKLSHLSTQLANNDRYKDPLAKMHEKPKPGLGTAMQEVSGGIGMGAQKGNTVFVDDKNWPVTLKEIIGSRMLTKEQLEKVSISNVKKLFTTGLNTGRHQGSASVGTSAEHEELYYMAQRMIIEGMIRGVDITKAIKERGGLNVAIRNVSYNENADGNIGLHSTGKGGSSINFNARHWRKMNEMEKYTLFMHEFGHGLLWQPEKDRTAYGIMGDGPYGVAKKLMSSKDAYNSILNYHFSSRGNKSLTAINKIAAGSGTSDFDPSWFPQLSGEAVKVDGGNYSPGAEGGPTTPDYSDEFKGINDQFSAMNSSFAKLGEMLMSQQEQMADMARDNQMTAIMNAGPDVQAQSMSMGGVAAPTVSAGSSGMGGMMGGAIDTTGFAQQLANLEGGNAAGAGNLLASG